MFQNHSHPISSLSLQLVCLTDCSCSFLLRDALCAVLCCDAIISLNCVAFFLFFSFLFFAQSQLRFESSFINYLISTSKLYKHPLNIYLPYITFC
mmetsp:Transcript_37481/g.52842  ORF Transcript_37481/g.52842 Transcript_37481/m.52842 type:complete len:95 (-) Transcript_37481:476-760(-)